jgi:hypothetical protein
MPIITIPDITSSESEWQESTFPNLDLMKLPVAVLEYAVYTSTIK